MYKILVTTTFDVTNNSSCHGQLNVQVIEFTTKDDANTAINKINSRVSGKLYRQYAIGLFFDEDFEE